MEGTPLLKVQDRVRTWINPKSFDVLQMRFLLMGNVINSTVGEIIAYRQIMKDVRGGELPSYLPNVFIMIISTLEALIAPFVSWFGFRKRRSVLLIYSLTVVLSIVSLYFLPSAHIRPESELCDAANSRNDISYRGMTIRSSIRLIILIMVTLVFMMSRVANWSHGLAYCDEFAPERTSVHYGALLLSRVIVFMVMAKMDEDLKPLQISGLLIGSLYNLMKVFCVVPKHAPIVNGVQKTELQLEDREFSLSMMRVVSKSQVLAIMLASSLLVAALWGLGYSRNEIFKVKFLIPPSQTIKFDEILQHIYIIMPIALAGVKFSVPILLEYCKKKALKQTVIMTTFAFIFFILLTVLPKCDQGSVAGLEDRYYNHPQCSLSCGCKPKWMEFNPVCVTDNMTTFLSPCHAGCSGTENINGVKVYTQCKCSGPLGATGATGASEGAKKALLGACVTDCTQQSHLHNMLYIVATTFTLLALQAQGVLILKVVDPRDRSVAMGLLLAMVAFVTFTFGRSIFLTIQVATCRWYEGGQCHIQTTKFPYLVGFCSSFLVLLSAIISIVSFIFNKMYDKEQLNDISL